MFKGESQQPPDVAIMLSRLPAEELQPVPAPGHELSQSAIDDQEQLDQLIDRNPFWQRQVDQPAESSKPED
jgi:hypothetical protein